MKTALQLAVQLRALQLESPGLGALNRAIVQAGGEPIPPREPWLGEATAELAGEPVTAEPERV